MNDYIDYCVFQVCADSGNDAGEAGVPLRRAALHDPPAVPLVLPLQVQVQPDQDPHRHRRCQQVGGGAQGGVVLSAGR